VRDGAGDHTKLQDREVVLTLFIEPKDWSIGMDTIKPLFTATATATGGRNGHTQASDGSVAADLSVPKAMGGPGRPGTTTPEHLFAAGYSACFGSAIDYVGKQHKKDASKVSVTADVSIGPRQDGGFGIAVKLRVEDPSLPQAELQALANEAHEKICPYSHAIRNNVDVRIDVKGA
jgi:lipoyl-dependent peroxiredoxin